MTTVQEGELFNDAPKPTKTKKKTGTAVAKAEDKPPANDVAVDDLIILARAAADPKVDPAKMQALREIMKDIREERRIEAFTRDLMKLQHLVPEIDKDGKIVIDPKDTARNKKRQVTLFSTFENINRTIMPHLKTCNFVIWHEADVGKEGTGVIVRSYLKHVGGHQISSSVPLLLDATGSKNNNQGAGSSLSYGKRYNTIMLCNIVSKAPQDRDLDGNAPKDEVEDETITDEQTRDLSAKITSSGLTLDRFCKKYGIKSVGDLPADKFKAAMADCDDYKSRAEKNRG